MAWYNNLGRKALNASIAPFVGPLGSPMVTRPAKEAVSNAWDIASGRRAKRDLKNAADQLKQAADQARQDREQGYNEAYDLQKPYLEMGNTALKDLYAGLNAGKYDYQAPSNQEYNSLAQQMISQDPGVDWRLKQGQKALEASAAARGMLMSSGQAKALNDYAQNQASQEYQQAYNRASNVIQDKYAAIRDNLNNHFNRLQSFANMGPQTATNLANNRLGLAGSNAGYREDLGNINAQTIQAKGAASQQAFNTALQTALGVGGLVFGGPMGGALATNAASALTGGVSSPKSMYSARQAPNDFYGYGNNGVKFDPYTDHGVAQYAPSPPADYSTMGDQSANLWRNAGSPAGDYTHMGNQLRDIWRQGYPY